MTFLAPTPMMPILLAGTQYPSNEDLPFPLAGATYQYTGQFPHKLYYHVYLDIDNRKFWSASAELYNRNYY